MTPAISCRPSSARLNDPRFPASVWCWPPPTEKLYGHHKKFADLTLAYAASVMAPAQGIEVTNLQAFLADSPATWEARLRPGENGEGTAWSCSHGLGRWLRDCGCRMDSTKNTSQAWRAPLRRALDLLRDRAAALFEDAAGDWFVDPWQARDDYGAVAHDGPDGRKQRLRQIAKPILQHDRGGVATRALLLMEMQRSLLLMYASCAWFFDDIAGAESAIALRRAAHAMDLWRRFGGEPPEKELIAVLAQARSNQPKSGTGADAYERACRDRFTPELVVARAAFSSFISTHPSVAELPGFELREREPGHRSSATSRSGQGRGD